MYVNKYNKITRNNFNKYGKEIGIIGPLIEVFLKQAVSTLVLRLASQLSANVHASVAWASSGGTANSISASYIRCDTCE